ncbi:beta-galactosidase [Colwellia sp. MB3u-70]|uniref:beta-galactosidase n=1 Tax=unclassified Colwellia TaxID=196834 RepID=UPI0015F7133F|nr:MULTISPECIES: beta-galactosidase [unclassified Colwellia]MBA6291112.1 beta-galactosidase [Colwellia sp. MB3u-8]MBA6308169.1 beta-galactosidase [Colwellia sp. MB3u-70]
MLGVCYYPEHWPEKMWAQDAKEMRELGLRYVRIGEFAWSRIEFSEGVYTFDWLDRAIETLADAGLEVIMCTPTATPPKWLIDKYPDILPVDINTGTSRGFGSRRHYDFSSKNYFREAMRISEVLAKRYGEHPAICGWQTDNEIACHDTTHSGSPAAKKAFHAWCQTRYKTIDKLNTDWGTVFWSMEYQSFDQIELPILAVTETHPAHQLAYRRFSSDQVIQFHNKMIAIIRQYAPDRFVTHNFIPMVDTQTDNYALAENLDFVSYDNYPLGRSDMFFKDKPAKEFKPYMRTGHPDFASYDFDQSRGISKKNFWIMEQQPGPVNWAHHNPRPEKGMVRLWSWQAFAHGADCVCYFRWRQAPFAQEQMHAGVKRNDNSKSAAWAEIEQMRDELKTVDFSIDAPIQARVAILSGTTNQWVSEIERQGDSYNHQKIEFSYYSALRQLGLVVDFISIKGDFSQYDLILAPCLPIVDDAFIEKCKDSNAHFVFGPRSGGKTDELSLAPNLPPGKLQALLPIKVLSTETIRPDCSEQLNYKDKTFESRCWREELEITKDVIVDARYHDQSPAVVRHENTSYIATLTCDDFLIEQFEHLATELDIATVRLPKDMRIVYRGDLAYIFNYAGIAQTFPAKNMGTYLLGQASMSPYDVAIIKLNN